MSIIAGGGSFDSTRDPPVISAALQKLYVIVSQSRGGMQVQSAAGGVEEPPVCVLCCGTVGN